jgi:alkylation response protein AidB-like acyl-CoA dehydrogenase
LEALQLKAFVDTARRFRRKEIDPMLRHESRDGDLQCVSEILQQAESVGLLAGAQPDCPGYDFGIWGRASLSAGPRFSLALLQETARSCAGVAACLHFAGLGALEAADAALPPDRTAVAFFEDQWRLSREALVRPPAHAVRIDRTAQGERLQGSKSFVYAAPGSEGFVVYASGRSGWDRLLIPGEGEGVTLTPLGPRTGLAAAMLLQLTFDQAPVDPQWRLPPVEPALHVQSLMLGLCAIALGNAHSALEQAGQYASERYQGGGQIRSHDAVRLLLGEAATRIAFSAAALEAVAVETSFTEQSLWRALGAKLRITEDCCQAVSDCLQVLGGYGYMEDFRLEKRLRDALTLKNMLVRPDDLRLFCATQFPGAAF